MWIEISFLMVFPLCWQKIWGIIEESEKEVCRLQEGIYNLAANDENEKEAEYTEHERNLNYSNKHLYKSVQSVFDDYKFERVCNI